jgi:hypothetical protein
MTATDVHFKDLVLINSDLQSESLFELDCPLQSSNRRQHLQNCINRLLKAEAV